MDLRSEHEDNSQSALRYANSQINKFRRRIFKRLGKMAVDLPVWERLTKNLVQYKAAIANLQKRISNLERENLLLKRELHQRDMAFKRICVVVETVTKRAVATKLAQQTGRSPGKQKQSKKTEGDHAISKCSDKRSEAPQSL